ncbi:MAG: hypothetical protein ABW321_09360, partial [Polyangiales bacterium]
MSNPHELASHRLDSRRASPRGERITLVLTAMPEEARALRAVLRATTRVQRRPALWRGQLGDTPLLLAMTGDGPRNAHAAATRVLDDPRWQIAQVLVLGVAGALSRELRLGDLVVATEVHVEAAGGPSPQRTLHADPTAVDSVARATGARRGVIVSATQIADTVAGKRQLLATCGSSGRPAVVDLESFSYVALAEARGLPWLVLRAVSDTADEHLPSMLRRCSDAGGAVQRGRVARALLRDPRPL